MGKSQNFAVVVGGYHNGSRLTMENLEEELVIALPRMQSVFDPTEPVNVAETFKTETFTLRKLRFPDGISYVFYAERRLSDFEAIRMVFEGYRK